MIGFLKKLFTRKKFTFDPLQPTIPEAFGFSLSTYKMLVDELALFIRYDDKLISLDQYLKGPLFNRFNLDLSNPNDAAIIGYAFCTAVYVKRQVQMKNAADKALEKFYDQSDEIDKTIN